MENEKLTLCYFYLQQEKHVTQKILYTKIFTFYLINFKQKKKNPKKKYFFNGSK